MPAAVLGQSEEVHRATNQRTSKTQGRKSCYRCGNPTHLAPTWSHRTSECKACGKMGHLATVCRSRSKRVTVDSSFQAKHVSEDQEECVFEDDATILTVSNARTPPLLVSLKLDGKDVTMELDTGASVSLMPYRAMAYFTVGNTYGALTMCSAYIHGRGHSNMWQSPRRSRPQLTN